MEYSIADVFDRYSILTLKTDRIQGYRREEYLLFRKEFDQILQQFDLINEHLAFLFDAIYYVNRQIWDLEADIRAENEEKLGLEEVGRRAILIREWNKQRIRIKNIINLITSTGFNERKSTW